MFQKKYFTFLLLGAFFSIGGSTVFAQTAPVSGRIEMKKTDGSSVPVAAALIEAYRVDIGGKGPTDKTDKKGYFSFAGLPLGATYVLSVSAPGAKPGMFPNVRAGKENIVITLEEGDGRRWTEAEIREAISGTAAVAATGKAAPPSQDEKKAMAERAKLEAEYAEKKQKAEGNNAIFARTLADGNKAFGEKKYDVAIANYTEGANADPTFIGSAPTFFNNKALALKLRGSDLYNLSVKTSDTAERTALQTKAKQDLQDSLASFMSSWKLLKDAPAAEIGDKVNYDKVKYGALNGLTELYPVLIITKTPIAQPAEAKEVFDAYALVESDAAKKAKAQIALGDIMLGAGESDMAIAAYRVVLETSPENPDALAGLGLSLVSLGYIKEEAAAGSGKAQFQEGMNVLQKFATTAPDNHKFKADVVATIEDLKNVQKVTPQKVTSTKKKN